MKNISLFVLCIVCSMLPIVGEVSKDPLTTIKFNQISILKVDALKTDIQFSLNDSNEISIRGEKNVLSSLDFNVSNTHLTIAVGKHSSEDLVTLQISVPSKCLLDISVIENSYVLIPIMNAPVRLNAKDLSYITIDGCSGLVLTGNEKTKIFVDHLNGDVSATVSDHSEFGVKNGVLEKVLITATELSRVSVLGSMKTLNLNTRGTADIKLGAVTDAFVWAGRGNEHVLVQKLGGIADVTASYHSMLTVESANLNTLLAATAANGKIKIGGTVVNAALSARGGSEIVIDKVTGKILRKNEMRKGSVKILNP